MKGVEWKKTLVAHTITLYSTCELACVVCQVKRENINTDKLNEESFCNERISYLHRIQRLHSLKQPGQFMGQLLINASGYLDKRLARKLVWLSNQRLASYYNRIWEPTYMIPMFFWVYIYYIMYNANCSWWKTFAVLLNSAGNLSSLCYSCNTLLTSSMKILLENFQGSYLICKKCESFCP